jgi:hypothetical protein
MIESHSIWRETQTELISGLGRLACPLCLRTSQDSNLHARAALEHSRFLVWCKFAHAASFLCRPRTSAAKTIGRNIRPEESESQNHEVRQPVPDGDCLTISLSAACASVPATDIPAVYADTASTAPTKTMRAFSSDQELAAYLRKLAEEQGRKQREQMNAQAAEPQPSSAPTALAKSDDAKPAKDQESVTNVQHAGGMRAASSSARRSPGRPAAGPFVHRGYRRRRFKACVAGRRLRAGHRPTGAAGTTRCLFLKTP